MKIKPITTHSGVYCFTGHILVVKLYCTIAVTQFGLNVELLTVFVAQSSWVPDRTRFLDYSSTTGNFLFRGSEPVNNGVFLYNDLVASMQAAAANASLVLPAKFVLIDYSFLDPELPKEFSDWNTERLYFEANPQVGTFAPWPIVGSLQSPAFYNLTERQQKAITLPDWEWDKVPDLEATLHKLLLTKDSSGLPLVVYIHCEAGVDRTGEVSGAYMMQYLNANYTYVMAYDYSIEGRDIETASEWGVQWYCLYLHWGLNYDSVPDCPWLH